MGTVKTDEGTTIDKPTRTGTVTDEQATELIFGSLFKNSDAVWVAGNDVLTILGECLIHCIVGAVIQLIRAFFGAESFGIRDFDTEFPFNVFNDIDWAIRRLFLEFIRDLFSEKGFASLRVTLVIDAETSML